MAIILNKKAYDHALSIVKKGFEVIHDHAHWHEIQPTPNEIAVFLNRHSLEEYGIWFLGIDTAVPENDQSRYLYPIGDLKMLHKSALLAVTGQSSQHKHHAIHEAAHHLLTLLE